MSLFKGADKDTKADKRHERVAKDKDMTRLQSAGRGAHIGGTVGGVLAGISGAKSIPSALAGAVTGAAGGAITGGALGALQHNRTKRRGGMSAKIMGMSPEGRKKHYGEHGRYWGRSATKALGQEKSAFLNGFNKRAMSPGNLKRVNDEATDFHKQRGEQKDVNKWRQAAKHTAGGAVHGGVLGALLGGRKGAAIGGAMGALTGGGLSPKHSKHTQEGIDASRKITALSPSERRKHYADQGHGMRADDWKPA